MNNISLKFIVLLVGINSCLFVSVSAQISLVNKGTLRSSIVVVENEPVNQTAAHLFQMFIERISGCRIPIVIGGNTKDGNIIIGGEAPTEVLEDGFSISSKGGVLTIKGRGKGTVYGVVT